ncbi:hypothetical protein B0J11DRAFT_516556 [Dendryphion nanum]|uniref:Uncharacterized protein n=1 Tax=Dendryphion nanum TaxID=256645 RepID=A0A9P9IZ88_9PLEO|nr:hypothetical protein B0J11DRAFT_516556 [Dendryphion nanum]
MPSLPIAQASHDLTQDFRNELYAALLSGTGIRNIETTLSQELQESGWLDKLKAYMQYLLREGLVTSHPELMEKVMEKIKSSNTDATNGTNGVNGTNGHSEGEEIDLRLPERVTRQGSKVVRQEVEKVCELV